MSRKKNGGSGILDGDWIRSKFYNVTGKAGKRPMERILLKEPA
jgi:hypothetical protein